MDGLQGAEATQPTTKTIPAMNHSIPSSVKPRQPQTVGRRVIHKSYWRLIYPIELDPAVLGVPAFAAANPNYRPGMPLFYVGSTSLRPEVRFYQHITGSKNPSEIAHEFGKVLRMDLCPNQKRLPRDKAIKKEVGFARELRAKGCGVWQA